MQMDQNNINTINLNSTIDCINCQFYDFNWSTTITIVDMSTTSITTGTPKNDTSTFISFNVEFIGYIISISIFIGWIFMSLTSCSCYRMKSKHFRGADRPNMSHIFVFFANIGDLATDLIFSVSLLLNDDYFEIEFYQTPVAYWSFLFIIAPYLLSLICCCCFVMYWRRKADRLKMYMNKYMVFMIISSFLTGFHSIVALFQSRIFFNNLFHLPLKKAEYNFLQKIKFVNITVCEVGLVPV